MTRREIAILGCKILGLFICIKYIPSFFGFVPILFSTFGGLGPEAGDLTSIVLQLFSWITLMLCGAGLWFQAKRIGQWVVPEDTPPASIAFEENFVKAALSIIAVVLLVISIPVLLQHLAANILLQQDATVLYSQDFPIAIIQFIFGTVILGNSPSLSRLIQYTSKSTFHEVGRESKNQMTRYAMVHLGCRLLGAYFIIIYTITLVSHLGSLVIISWLQNSLTPLMLASQIASALYFFIVIAAGLWLWLGANQFAKKVTGRDFSKNPLRLNLDILPLLISFVGLWVLVNAVPGLINNLSMYYIRAYYSTPGTIFLLTGVTSGAKVLLGLLLFFASQSITHKIQSVQSVGCSFKRWLKNPSGSGIN